MASSVRLGDAPATTVALGPSRAKVLAALRSADAPVTVGDLARRVGLHTNTARFHLEGLVEAGIAERTVESRSVPGRPRTLYCALTRRADGRRSYRLLAEILAGSLVGSPSAVAVRTAAARRPAAVAQAAGHAWGRFLTDRPSPTKRLDPPAATAGLTAVLDDIGFAPEPVTVGRRRQILLHHCPFLEVAQENPEVVCSVHLGLMQGVLEELRAPLRAERLDPFVRPDLCVAHLASPRRRAGASGGAG